MKTDKISVTWNGRCGVLAVFPVRVVPRAVDNPGDEQDTHLDLTMVVRAYQIDCQLEASILAGRKDMRDRARSVSALKCSSQVTVPKAGGLMHSKSNGTVR